MAIAFITVCKRETNPVHKCGHAARGWKKIANLKLYTTPIAMDDLDEVRTALGYDKIDLVGGSYGTFAAQIYMRQHAEHIRAVFLAGVAPPTRGKQGGDNTLACLCPLVVSLLPQRKGLRELRALREYEMRSPSGYR